MPPRPSIFNPAQTIDEVIARLDGFIESAQREKSRLGYFAALYRKMTAAVKHGIAAGQFGDRPRMNRLVVNFANRYFEAWHQHRAGGQPTKCWRYAFAMAKQRRALILQHLLLGINAHINLDLGVAAAQTCPRNQYPALKRDFDTINRVLASLLEEVQREIAVVSPMFGLLDQVGGRTDEAISNFSLSRARAAAWLNGQRLASLDRRGQHIEIGKQDLVVTALAAVVCNPAMFAHPTWSAVCAAESDDVGRVIDVLR
jgi:hypothetical protein